MSVAGGSEGGATHARAAPSNLNWANAFTLLRVALVPVFAWLLLVREPPLPVLAAIVFVIAAATDGLDGYVARRLHVVTGFGEFLDPLADKLLIGTALVALAAADRMPWWAVAVILGREFAISGLRVWLARTGRSLPASMAGKAKTLSQIVAVVLLTIRPPRRRDRGRGARRRRRAHRRLRSALRVRGGPRSRRRAMGA